MLAKCPLKSLLASVALLFGLRLQLLLFMTTLQKKKRERENYPNSNVTVVLPAAQRVTLFFLAHAQECSEKRKNCRPHSDA